jgi:hypothetical protein
MSKGEIDGNVRWEETFSAMSTEPRERSSDGLNASPGSIPLQAICISGQYRTRYGSAMTTDRHSLSLPSKLSLVLQSIQVNEH